VKTPFPPVAEQSCLNCIYLRDGFCRRNAPVVLAKPSTWYTYAQASWPLVLVSDWCGEWISREVGL